MLPTEFQKHVRGVHPDIRFFRVSGCRGEQAARNATDGSRKTQEAKQVHFRNGRYGQEDSMIMRMSECVTMLLVGIAVTCAANQVLAADLFVDSVEVAATKAGGDGWDFAGNAPDPFVIVRFDGRTSTTAYGSDTHLVRYSHRAARGLSVGDRVQVEVWDKDFTNHDLVGSETITITHSMLASGQIDLSFDQVRSLQLSIEN